MIKRFITTPTRLALNRFGLELVKKVDKGLVELSPLEHPCDAIYQHGDVAFEVPIEKCRYPYHFSYDPTGWHPFVATLLQYKENPHLRYSDSVLYRYYSVHQPKTVAEAFFVTPQTAEESELKAFPIPPYEPFFPWDPHKPRTKAEKGLDPSHGNQGFGPVSNAKGELEFQRLTETFESVKRKGYRPRSGHDGDIRGYFLRTNDDYRFVVRQGLHRAAVLSAMGYSKLRLRFFQPYPRTIFLADLNNWPQVKNGVIRKSTAEHLFQMFFEENGTQKAGRLDLIRPTKA